MKKKFDVIEILRKNNIDYRYITIKGGHFDTYILYQSGNTLNIVNNDLYNEYARVFDLNTFLPFESGITILDIKNSNSISLSGISEISNINGNLYVNNTKINEYDTLILNNISYTYIGNSSYGFSFKINGDFSFVDIIYYLNAIINPNITYSVSEFGSLRSSLKWFGGILAPNGCIYGIPDGYSIVVTTILKIDTSNDTVTEFGNVSKNLYNWSGGVLAPNGCIYGIPHNSTTILKIDTSNDTVTEFGNVSTNPSKWFGGVLAPNGCIYGIPHGTSIVGKETTTILKIDTSNDTVTEFGNVSTNALKWCGGVLAPNGCIYGIPYGISTIGKETTTILKIDTSNDTVTEFGNVSTNALKWCGGVLAPNGCIYGIPHGYSTVGKETTTILKIDTSNDTITEFGNVSKNRSKWFGGVLAPNGCIYGIPNNSTTILKIDTSNDTVTEFGNVSANSVKWCGGVLTPNGCIYGIPNSSTTILKLTPNIPQNLDINWLTSGYF
jgi:hypothetical protein